MNREPIKTIQPVVIPAQFLVWVPLIGIPVSLFASFFLSGMLGMFFRVDPFGRDPLQIPIFILVFLACIVVIGGKVFLEPGRTLYKVYTDRVEYYEGLWNRHERTVVYDQVIDVALTEGVLQQTRQAGTITLVTKQLVSEGEGQLSNRKIAIKNIPSPKEVYELIRSLALKKGAEQAAPADRPREPSDRVTRSSPREPAAEH